MNFMQVRKLIYTLLSPKFYTGIAVGFLLASFFTPFVNAQQTRDTINNDHSLVGSCTNNNTDFYIYVTPENFIGGAWLRSFQFAINASGKEFVASVSEPDSTSTVLAIATSTTNSSIYAFAFPEYTKSTSKGLLIFIDNLGYLTTNSYKSTSPSKWHFTTTKAGCSNYTPAGIFELASSSAPAVTNTVPLYTPLLLDKLEEMNCTYTSTTTQCIPQYASTTNAVTPENIFYIFVIFVIAFLLTVYAVRKFN